MTQVPPFEPSDAQTHTSFANTQRRQVLWSSIANRVWFYTRDKDRAAKQATRALYEERNRRTQSKISPHQPRLL